jgi:hypothetical protein
MSKVIISPIERFKGSVTIADPLTIPQAQAVEIGIDKPKTDAEGRAFLSAYDNLQLPGVFACVEKWELENMPDNLSIDNFPASPRKDTHDLISWIYKNIFNVYLGEIEIPNVLNPTPSDIVEATDIPAK